MFYLKFLVTEVWKLIKRKNASYIIFPLSPTYPVSWICLKLLKAILLQTLRSPKDKPRNLQNERGRINTEESVSAHGVNGRLRSVTREKGSESGLEPSTLLKKLPEPTMLRHAGSEARRPRLTFLKKTHPLSINVQLKLALKDNFQIQSLLRQI